MVKFKITDEAGNVEYVEAYDAVNAALISDFLYAVDEVNYIDKDEWLVVYGTGQMGYIQEL